MCYIISDYCGQVYNSIITLHGVGMIFLFIMPYLIGVVGNKEIPLKLSIADFQLVYISTSGILKPESQMPKKRPRVEKILLK